MGFEFAGHGVNLALDSVAGDGAFGPALWADHTDHWSSWGCLGLWLYDAQRHHVQNKMRTTPRACWLRFFVFARIQHGSKLLGGFQARKQSSVSRGLSDFRQPSVCGL